MVRFGTERDAPTSMSDICGCSADAARMERDASGAAGPAKAKVAVKRESIFFAEAARRLEPQLCGTLARAPL